jgi:hypothetical protein
MRRPLAFTRQPIASGSILAANGFVPALLCGTAGGAAESVISHCSSSFIRASRQLLAGAASYLETVQPMRPVATTMSAKRTEELAGASL